jgi:hypothetical protein
MTVELDSLRVLANVRADRLLVGAYRWDTRQAVGLDAGLGAHGLELTCQLPGRRHARPVRSAEDLRAALRQIKRLRRGLTGVAR